MSFTLTSQALAEFDAALAYYLENAGIVVANRFVGEFERAAKLIDRYPALGSPALRSRRIFPLRRFPYSLIYRVSSDALVIVAVAHQRRQPAYWAARH